MGDDLLLLLGPEGDRLDAYAVLHGVAASLALPLARRLREGTRNRRIARQARAMIALATALARAFLHDGDGVDVDALVALMARAGRCGSNGVAYDQLITLSTAWPLRGLAINPPALALAAIMRLREALQSDLVVSGSPRRAAQLRVIRDLEADVLVIARDLKGGAISMAEALRRVRARFAAAAPAIGTDLVELLGGEAAATHTRIVMHDQHAA